MQIACVVGLIVIAGLWNFWRWLGECKFKPPPKAFRCTSSTFNDKTLSSAPNFSPAQGT